MDARFARRGDGSAGAPQGRGVRHGIIGKACLAALAFVMTMAAPGTQAQDLSAWAHSAEFRLNTTATGADIAGDVADFPVLLRLDSSMFPFDQARPDGADIRFTAPDGAALPFQVERWDAAVRRAEVRVKVPVVKGNSDSGFVRMHWGNPAAGSESRPDAVFAPASGYAGVWHLQGDALTDASGNGGAADGSHSARAAGLIADGRILSGNNQGVLAPDAKALNADTAITVSLWIKADNWSGGAKAILQKGSSDIQYSLSQDPGMDSMAWTLGGLASGQTLKSPLPAAGAWHWIVGTYDGATSRLFIDGAMAASHAASGALRAGTEEVCMGCRGAAGKPRNTFKGLLDEVVIARTAWTPDRIKLAFANQRAQQRLVLHPTLVECVADFGAPAALEVREGAAFTLKGRAACASAFYWSAVSGPVPRILDPETDVLQVTAPRITQDTVLTYRFTATYGGADRAAEVAVRVKEAVPEPLVSLPPLKVWNGKDSLVLRPVISNLAAIKASPDTAIHLAWTVSGPATDTAWANGALVLKGAATAGELTVGVCADNGGAPRCASALFPVDPGPTALKITAPERPKALRIGRDAAGRRSGRTAAGIRYPLSFPGKNR